MGPVRCVRHRRNGTAFRAPRGSRLFTAIPRSRSVLRFVGVRRPRRPGGGRDLGDRARRGNTANGLISIAYTRTAATVGSGTPTATAATSAFGNGEPAGALSARLFAPALASRPYCHSPGRSVLGPAHRRCVPSDSRAGSFGGQGAANLEGCLNINKSARNVHTQFPPCTLASGRAEREAPQSPEGDDVTC